MLGTIEKVLRNLFKRIRRIKRPSPGGVKFEFTPAMKVIVREILAKCTTPPILVFLDWDVVADDSRPFHVYCEACTDSYGAAHRLYQPRYLDSEGHWAPLDLEAGIIDWVIELFQGYLWNTKSHTLFDHKALESMGKVGDHNARVQRWLEYLTVF